MATKELSDYKRITHTYLSGKLSTTLIIPIETARKYGIDKPSNVIVEETDDGILIKKLEIKG
jgi:adenosine deaminase